MQTLDHIHQLLSNIAGHAHPSVLLTDSAGTPRLILRLPVWNDYLIVALADIVALAPTSSPMVGRRLTVLIDDLAGRVEPADGVCCTAGEPVCAIPTPTACRSGLLLVPLSGRRRRPRSLRIRAPGGRRLDDTGFAFVVIGGLDHHDGSRS